MKHIKFTFLLTVLMSMVGIGTSAHSIVVKNDDGVFIYYKYVNNKTELAVTCRGSSYDSYSNEYTGAVNIPSSVTYDGKTYSVTSIGGVAFYGCTALTSITIPNSVTSIGGSAFYKCSGLKKVIFPDIAAWCKISFGSEYANPLYYAKHIYSDENTEITDLVIPNSVTRIGSYAFWKCSGLTSITIPNSVTRIGESAFYGCSGLTSITIPNSVTSIGDDAFLYCSGLKKVIVPDIAAWCNISFGNYDANPLYYAKHIYSDENTEIKDLVIPNSVTTIRNYAFFGCGGLTSITIPNSVTSIGSNAFSECTGLTSITIPNSVKTIDYGAFRDCSSLTKVIVPDIAAWCKITFGDYYGNPLSYAAHIYSDENTEIKDLVIPNSVTRIGESAFYGCYGLTSIIIPNSVTSIGNYAFRGCSGLTSITIPNSVTSIGDKAFSGCGNLVSVEINSNAILSKSYTSSSSLVNIFGDQVQNYIIGNDVTTIGSGAFYGCSGLKSVTIGNSVTSIGSSVFYNTRLKSVTIGAGVLSISSDSFSYSDSSTGAKPVKVIWLTNTPPSGYGKVCGKVNYVANDLYKGLSNMTVYPFLSSMFETGGVKYVPVSPSERTCDAIDCVYDESAANVNIGKTLSYKGINMTVNNINTYTCYKNPFIKSADVSYNGSIGDYAFYGCGSLNNVTLSNNGDIGISAFESSNIASTLVVKNTGNIGEDAFRNITGSYTATISNSGSIGNNAFRGCIGMISATIENNGSIGAYAFQDNTGMISVTIENNGSIGAYAFQNNTSMISATIENNGSIGTYAFSGNTSLEKAILGDKVTSLGDYVFSGCSSLQGIDIPNGITQMGSYAFRNCSNMTSAKIGTGVTAINESTFSGCSALKDVQIGSNVRTIGNYVFSGCTSLPVINIPKAVTSIGNYTFQNCKALREVVMEDRADDTVLSLGSNGSSPMFASCPLDKVYIGRNISYNKTSNYGYSPFYRNTSLRSVTITDRETEVSENEFYGCTNLKEVKIGDGVTTIGSWAFSGCAAIDYFAFGSSVKTIGQEAFSDCTAMTRLISRAATPPSCGSQALDDINKWTCTLSVPAGSTSAYQAAAQWKEFFFIDNDVTGIEAVAAESVSNAEITDIYDLNGRRRDALQPGINIVKMSDGTTKKVVAK